MFKAAIILCQRANITVNGQAIGWKVAQTSGQVINALRSTCLAVSSSHVLGIVGPGLSREAHSISSFAQAIGIPVVSYAATDPDLSNRNMYPAFFRTVPSDQSAGKAIVKLFQRYNWTSCILIYQNDAFGSVGAKAIGETFENNGLRIRELILFDIAAMAIRGNLTSQLLNSAARVIVLWADPTYTSTILEEAGNNDLLAPRFLWILSTSISFKSLTERTSKALIGMLSVEPVSGSWVGADINTTLLTAAYDVWKGYELETFPGETKVDPYALFAFDAAWLLIQSLQQLCSTENESNIDPCLAFSNSTFCFDRQLINSSSFFDQISQTKFLGVSGPIEYQGNGTDRIDGIHYITRNVQTSPALSFVSTLKYSEPGDWQVYQAGHEIIWPGKVSTVPSDRATLSGVTLRIGLVESRPFTRIEYIIDKEGRNLTKFIGYIPDLIDLLKGRMNFTPQLFLAPTNQTYTGLVKSVARGDFDIVMGDVTVTSLRREVAAFSASIFDNALRLIIRKPVAEQVDFFSYLRPFSPSLWVAIFVTTIYTSFLICLLERHDNEALRDRSILSMAAMAIWYSIGNIMGYGVDFHVTTASGRLLTVALYILSLVLVASYTANLASNLTISKTKYIISGIEDMKQGKLAFNRIGIRVGTAAEEFYVREISRGSRNFYPLKSRQELFDRLLSGDIDVSFMDIGAAEYMTNNIYCNLTLVGASFDGSMFGIVFPKNWLHIQDFDINVLALRELGELDTLKKKWFETKLCDDSVETPIAMGAESMVGLFLTVGLITVLALVTVLWTKRTAIKNCLLSLKDRQYTFKKKKDASTRSTDQLAKSTSASPFADPDAVPPPASVLATFPFASSRILEHNKEKL